MLDFLTTDARKIGTKSQESGFLITSQANVLKASHANNVKTHCNQYSGSFDGNNPIKTTFPQVPYHGIVGYFDAKVAVAVSVLQNHSDLQTEQQQQVNLRIQSKKKKNQNSSCHICYPANKLPS